MWLFEDHRPPPSKQTARRRTGEEEVDAGQVIGQGVEPHVEDVAGLEAGGHGDAPVEGGAGDGEVHQVLLEARCGGMVMRCAWGGGLIFVFLGGGLY